MGFDVFWIIVGSLSANAHFASVSTAAVDFCLIGEYLDFNWKVPNLKPGLYCLLSPGFFPPTAFLAPLHTLLLILLLKISLHSHGKTVVVV